MHGIPVAKKDVVLKRGEITGSSPLLITPQRRGFRTNFTPRIHKREV